MARSRGQCQSTGFALRQICMAHQIPVALTSGAATFVEGPDDKALSAAAIAGGEDAREAGGIFLVLGLHVAARVALDAEGVEERLLRPKETHRKEDELRGQHLLGAGNILRHERAL